MDKIHVFLHRLSLNDTIFYMHIPIQREDSNSTLFKVYRGPQEALLVYFLMKAFIRVFSIHRQELLKILRRVLFVFSQSAFQVHEKIPKSAFPRHPTRTSSTRTSQLPRTISLHPRNPSRAHCLPREKLHIHARAHTRGT